MAGYLHYNHHHMATHHQEGPHCLYRGTFDVFHVGHVKFLEQCANIAGEDGEVVVALNTDEFIREYKGKPSIYSYEDRECILKACRYVDKVVPNSGGADSKPSILSVCPDFIVIGSDWAKRDYYAQMGFTQEWLNDNNIGLIYVPYTEGISTTEVKASIRSQLNG
jgi:glycerol-3-phosphate cytidylyltransferase